MAERKSVHLDKAQRDAISDLVEGGHADRESEALRQLLNAGMREYGFPKGNRTLVPLEKQSQSAITQMIEDGEAVNEIQAHKNLLTAGMKEYGYQSESGDTFLKMAINRLGWLLGTAGVAGLAFTLTYPVSARLPSFALVVFSLACFGLYRVLENYEPKVTRGILGLLGKGESA